MTAINPHIFRAYDIRGKAGSDITDEVCRKIGHMFGMILRERYNVEHPKVVVGWDARAHSPGFAKAITEGLMASGCHVFSMGQTPSPLNYFTICTRGLDGGVQITASHNPKEDNGIKLQVRDAEAYSGDDLQDLRKRIEAISDQRSAISGGNQEKIDAVSPYLSFLKKEFDVCAKGLKVVIDAGNGIAGLVYSEAIEQAGAKVTGLYLEPDGTFPHHPADPSQHQTLQELQEKVRNEKADIGIAFDGDGDRLGIIDEQGMIRTPDEILLLLAEDLLQRHAGLPVIFTVSCSAILETELPRLGGKPVMCKVGHSYVEHAMREHGALLGGEQSGHFFCGEDYFGFDDALVAALRVLKILKAKGTSLSAVLRAFPEVFQAPERRPFCPDDRKGEIVRNATAFFAKSFPVNTLDGARIDFGNGAWAGIRQSNTSPKLSICMEARSKEKLIQVEKTVLDYLRGFPEVKWD